MYLLQGDVIFYFLPEQRVFTIPIKQHMLVIIGSQSRPSAAEPLSRVFPCLKKPTPTLKQKHKGE